MGLQTDKVVITEGAQSGYFLKTDAYGSGYWAEVAVSGAGSSGYSGYSGSGVSGFSGFSGYSGQNAEGGGGTSGYSGYSGYINVSSPLYYRWDPDAPPSSPHAKDDEFDDDSLSGNWTEWDGGGKITLTENEYGLNIVNTNTAAADHVGGVFTSVPTGDWRVITKVSIGGKWYSNYASAGVFIAEDLSSNPNTADFIAIWLFFTKDRDSNAIVVQRYTAYNAYNSEVMSGKQYIYYGYDDVYFQIRKESTNYYYYYSGDGISWQLIGSSSNPFTVSSFGLATNNVNQGVDTTAYFKFFRVVADSAWQTPVQGRTIAIAADASAISGYSGYSGSGISGYSGYSGTSGYSGPAGAGESGYSGYSGYSGHSGISGYSGYSGSGVSGYSGYSGISGYSGHSGPSGYSGYSGISGYSGYSGISGYSGYSGYSGSGISGYSGYSGISGYSGYSGISGYSGYSGISGYSGYSGYSGSGISGYSGYSGISGYSGSGISGYSGYSGISGYSGYSGSGISGYSGYSGISGYSGYSGPSGYSGYSGISGYSGYSGTSGYSGEGCVLVIDQTAHGFLVGDVLRMTTTENVFTEALADNSTRADALGIVSEVVNENRFRIMLSGLLTSGVPNFEAGSTVFLSPTVPGAMTDIEPNVNDHVSKALGYIIEPEVAMIVQIMRGVQVIHYGYVGLANKDSDYTITGADELIYCVNTSPINITLPAASGSGRAHTIKCSSYGHVTVLAGGLDTIEGETSFLMEANEGLEFVDLDVNVWGVL